MGASTGAAVAVAVVADARVRVVGVGILRDGGGAVGWIGARASGAPQRARRGDGRAGSTSRGGGRDVRTGV